MASGCGQVEGSGGAGGAGQAGGDAAADVQGFRSAMSGAAGGGPLGFQGAGGAGALGFQGAGGFNSPGAQFLRQAADMGYFQVAGSPQLAGAAVQLYGDLLSANPDMMSALAQHFREGGTWTVEAGLTQGERTDNQGRSFATVGQPNAYTYLDFGDAQFGMYEVGAHEFGHAIDGLGHVEDLFTDAEQREQRLLSLLRAA